MGEPSESNSGVSTQKPDAAPKTGPCVMIDEFRRMLRSCTREGYGLEFSHRHTGSGECRVLIEIHEKTPGPD